MSYSYSVSLSHLIVLDSQSHSQHLPGGMLSNLVSQLTAQKAADKYEDVLKEIPRVREDKSIPMISRHIQYPFNMKQ